MKTIVMVIILLLPSYAMASLPCNLPSCHTDCKLDYFAVSTSSPFSMISYNNCTSDNESHVLGLSTNLNLIPIFTEIRKNGYKYNIVIDSSYVTSVTINKASGFLSDLGSILSLFFGIVASSLFCYAVSQRWG